MTKLMNKQQTYMEKMLALLLLVFAIGLLVGERLRDHLYGERIVIPSIAGRLGNDSLFVLLMVAHIQTADQKREESPSNRSSQINSSML
jgi:ABC-type enterochelin transport system permease subunit